MTYGQPQIYSDEEPVEDLQRVAETVGGTPTMADCSEHGIATGEPLWQHSGCWVDAHCAAGRGGWGERGDERSGFLTTTAFNVQFPDVCSGCSQSWRSI